jgi:hypothetical protein
MLAGSAERRSGSVVAYLGKSAVIRGIRGTFPLELLAGI